MELMPHLKLPDNLGGPIIGGICGAANNLIYGFTTGDSITLVYVLTSLGIGIAVGIMARLGRIGSSGQRGGPCWPFFTIWISWRRISSVSLSWPTARYWLTEPGKRSSPRKRY